MEYILCCALVAINFFGAGMLVGKWKTDRAWRKFCNKSIK